MSHRHSIRAVPPSPTTDVHISTWQFETSAGAPQLGFKNFKDSPLTMNNPYFERSPDTTMSTSNLLATRSRPSSASANDTPSPSPLPRDTSTTLRSPFNGKISQSNYIHQPQSNYTLTSLLTPTRLPLSPQSSPPQSSSSAVSPSENTNTPSRDSGAYTASNNARSTPLGKSGRVIERLMADIDRLKRELLIETTRRQELERRDEATKDTLARLQTEVGHLERAKDTETTALRRRDRKIDEMRLEVERERERRERAETEARDAARIADERVAEAEERSRRAAETAERTELEMLVLQEEYIDMEKEYRRRTEALETVFEQVLEEKEEEKAKVQRLDVVLEQMGQEIERANKVNAKMGVAFEQYKSIKEEEVRVLQEKTKGLEELDVVTREETLKVLEEARWLVTLNKRHVDRKMSSGPDSAIEQDTAGWQGFWKKA